MNFNVGDYIKKPNGNTVFEVLGVSRNKRFGDIRVKNLSNNKEYWTFSWSGFIITNKHTTLIKTSFKNKFNFKNSKNGF
jgi:hypothetical protein